MNNLVNLMSKAGAERTLIIACGEYALNKHIEFNDSVFIYALSESTLHQHDPLEKEWIQHYIESKGCTRVVIVGSVHEHLIKRLVRSESLVSPAASLRFNMKVFLRNQDKEIIRGAVRDQILVELHVIHQCNLLMEYYFIQERVRTAKLQVRGFVMEETDLQLKEIFYNGTIYNDIISMN